MNTTFLVIMFVVILITIGLWVLAARSEWCSGWEGFGQIGGMAGAAVSFTMLLASLIGNTGSPLVTETTAFTVEKTPYRVVIQIPVGEATFKDAWTVANADRIVRVRTIYQRNAWGWTHEGAFNGGMRSNPRLELLLDSGPRP